MRDPNGLWRMATAVAVAEMVVAALFMSAGGSAPPHIHGATHDHAAGAMHEHSVPIGGPSARRDASVARYFGPKKPYAGPTKGIACDAGSRPEKVQGKASAADYENGRAKKGYFCNARVISRFGTSGGYRVERYVDKAGHECAYWDSTLLWPHNVPHQGTEGPGAYVMDMSNPSRPVHTDTLRTPAMQSPHESLRLNTKRGLLVADMGYPTWQPGFVDVYSLKEDCRHPVLESSTPMGILGHEGGFSPDGKTFYVASLYGHTLTAVDLRDLDHRSAS